MSKEEKEINGKKVVVEISYNAKITPEKHNDIQMKHLRSYPALALCTHCNKSGFTVVERSINWINCLFACCCECCWAGYMLYYWKDPNCCNAKHNCSNCGMILVNYDAMY